MKAQNAIQYELPTKITEFINQHCKNLGYQLEQHEILAQQIQKLSDFYIHNPKEKTPEFSNNKWAEIASLVYYFPLNFLRNLKVFNEAQRVGFFQDITNVVEFGSGFGPSSWAIKCLSEQIPVQRLLWIERNTDVSTYAESFKKMFSTNLEFFSLSQSYNEKICADWQKQNTMAIFSYSLTELNELPQWCKNFEALAIIEPSTQEDGRRLQELRAQLIHQGYSIWAPCLHEQECPLLKHSKKDWCHDRLFFKKPQWLEKIENHLAWENNSLTYSYLLARKKTPAWKVSPPKNTARVIGDTLYEKGKTRQMICYNDERLFLAWLKKFYDEAPSIPRGQLASWDEFERKANEIRPINAK